MRKNFPWLNNGELSNEEQSQCLTPMISLPYLKKSKYLESNYFANMNSQFRVKQTLFLSIAITIHSNSGMSDTFILDFSFFVDSNTIARNYVCLAVARSRKNVTNPFKLATITQFRKWHALSKSIYLHYFPEAQLNRPYRISK